MCIQLQEIHLVYDANAEEFTFSTGLYSVAWDKIGGEEET
jgi:hypothetical protein